VRITTNQPNTNSNPNPNHNHTTKQHNALGIIQLQYSRMSYVSKEMRTKQCYCTFLLLSVVIIPRPFLILFCGLQQVATGCLTFRSHLMRPLHPVHVIEDFLYEVALLQFVLRQCHLGSASKMTYIVLGGALNSTHSPLTSWHVMIMMTVMVMKIVLIIKTQQVQCTWRYQAVELVHELGRLATDITGD